MNLSDEIRKQIEKNKGLKLAVGEINNHLSILEGLARKDISERLDEAYKKGFEDGKKAPSELASIAEYQRGLDDAWEAARKIIHMPEGDLLNIFTECYSAVCTALQVLLKYDAAEAIAKLKAYEEKQKTDDEIKVGDEVEVAEKGIKFFVTKIYDADGTVGGINKDGEVRYWSRSLVKRTGRNIDIPKILEEMRT